MFSSFTTHLIHSHRGVIRTLLLRTFGIARSCYLFYAHSYYYACTMYLSAGLKHNQQCYLFIYLFTGDHFKSCRSAYCQIYVNVAVLVLKSESDVKVQM